MKASKGTILVTGAAKRIGRTVALALARAGWDIAAHYNSSAADAESLAQEIRALKRNVTLLQADFEKPEDVESLFAALPPLTGVVHNASLLERDENDPSGMRHRRVNLDAPLFLTKKLFESLPKEKTADVIFVLDNTPMPSFLSGYAESRKELRGAIASLARHFAPTLRVNALALGPVLKGARESEKHFHALVEGTLLKKPVAPEEVASAALFLLETPSVVGNILNLDSGSNLLRF